MTVDARRSLAKTTAIGMILVLSAALGAEKADAQTVLRACFIPKTGVVYRIGVPGAPDECRSDRHIEFSWTDANGADHGALAGLADDDHPDYVREGETADGDLDGTYPDPTVDGLQGNAVAASPAPSDGDVLTWNGTASAWAPAAPSGGGGASDHGALTGLDDDDHTQYVLADGVRSTVNGFAVTGTIGTGSIPAQASGTRVMWSPSRAAFRAGQVDGFQWANENTGNHSVAMGNNTTAVGAQSVAMGNGTTASGQHSVAMGNGTTASGARAVALGQVNTASGSASTALGGGTVASGPASTALGNSTDATGNNSIAMGQQTTASGQNSTATGQNTEASGLASTAMGSGTVASAENSTAIGGGTTASGVASTAMGAFTTASGLATVAMGRNASTDGNQGSFVFGDASTGDVLLAPAAHSFTVRASGGTQFYSSSDLSTGVELIPGSGAWASVSDRNRKENFRPEDGEAALARIAAMPIESWNYKAQGSSIRHLGPTAQDFYAAFGLGDSETTITTIDIDGVNLLAVQALEKRTADLQDEVTSLKEQNAILLERLLELEASLQVPAVGVVGRPGI